MVCSICFDHTHISWGRGSETYGEDPFLTSSMTKSFVQALQEQTKDGLLKVGATCKHFAGYSLEQWSGISRFEFNAIINARDLQETYLPAFEACVDAKVSSIMCSYNFVNGSQNAIFTYSFCLF